MDETFQDGVDPSPPNTARDGGAWLDPITIPADGPDPLAGNTRDFLTTVASNPSERAEAFWQWIQARIEYTGCPHGKAHPQAPKPNHHAS